MYESAIVKLNRRSPDIRDAVLEILQAAKVGYVPAKIKAAWCHLYGEGVVIDIEYAKSVFTELSEQGNPDAHAVSK